jgi:hypothetical protein
VRPGCHPQIDDVDGVPHNLTISRLSGCGGEDAKQANNSCRIR